MSDTPAPSPARRGEARPALPARADFTFWTEEKLRFRDTDMLGHVNNAVFAEFCEAGRVELLDAAGGARSAEHAVVVVRVVVNFLQELHYPGSISIGSAVTEVGNTSFIIVQGFFKGETCVGTTEAVCVTIDPATRRARPVPAALRARLTTVAPPRMTEV